MGALTSAALGLVAALASFLAPELLMGLATTGTLGVAAAVFGSLRASRFVKRAAMRFRWLALATAACGALIFGAPFVVGDGGLYTLIEIVCGAIIVGLSLSSYWVTQEDAARKTAPFAPRTGPS